MDWQFYNPTRVIFKTGALQTLPDLLGKRRAIVITSAGFRSRGLVSELEGLLMARLEAVFESVKSNPDIRDIDRLASECRHLSPDVVVALGGGSCIDSAKAVACLLGQRSQETLAAHFRSQTPLDHSRTLPVIAIPTTSGTGSEVTPFATIWDIELKRKHSLTSDFLYPEAALLDPHLTLTLPKHLTISTALDAISHAFESSWNRSANPITLAYSRLSLQLSLKSLEKSIEDPSDLLARGQMMQAAMLAGLAISQTKTALAHSISYPLTINFGVPHGLACSFTLGELLRFNSVADDGRLSDLAQALGYSSLKGLAQFLDDFLSDLDVSRLIESYLPNTESALELVDEMFTPSRSENNLRTADKRSVCGIVKRSLHRKPL